MCVHYYVYTCLLTWCYMYIYMYLMCNISYECICTDQLPTPVNIATFSNSTTAVLTVSFGPQCCNTVQLNVDITTNSSSATIPVVLPVDSTDPTNTTIVITDVTEVVSYTASIWSVCRDANNLLEYSGVLVVNFVTYGECVHPCVHMRVCIYMYMYMHTLHIICINVLLFTRSNSCQFNIINNRCRFELHVMFIVYRPGLLFVSFCPLC